jgi:hypothetical protein
VSTLLRCIKLATLCCKDYALTALSCALRWYSLNQGTHTAGSSASMSIVYAGSSVLPALAIALMRKPNMIRLDMLLFRGSCRVLPSLLTSLPLVPTDQSEDLVTIDPSREPIKLSQSLHSLSNSPPTACLNGFR